METTELIKMYIWALAPIAVIPLVLDICLAYWSKYRMRQVLVNESARNQLDKEELKEFIKELGKPPPGISGLARTVMALTVIVILGIAVLHLLVQGSEDNSIVENVLSMPAGLLAAITGFYFGGRAAEKKPEEGQPVQAPQPPESAGGGAGHGKNAGKGQ